MINNQNSRRAFLGSMAVLTVGTAFGSAARLFSGNTQPGDLKAMWTQFCRQHAGQHTAVHVLTNNILANKGHWHKEGELVAFPQHNLLARPTWVYWGENKVKPSDVIVSFYESNDPGKKLFRLNRFELAAFLKLSAEAEQQDVFVLMKKACGQRSSNDRDLAQTVKVQVRKGRQVSVTARFSAKETTINQQFIYSV